MLEFRGIVKNGVNTETREVDVLKNNIALKWGQGHHKPHPVCVFVQTQCES